MDESVFTETLASTMETEDKPALEIEKCQVNTSLQFFVALFFILAIAGISYMSQQDESILFPVPKDKDVGVLDYFALGTTIKSFNAEGDLTVLNADRIYHYLNKDITKIKSPVVWQNKNGSRWQTSARLGVLHKNNRLELRQHVVLTYSPEPSTLKENKTYTVRTNLLNILTDKRYAYTKNPVTIERGNSKIRAVGMQIDYNNETIKLLSNVRGVYGN